ncbi:Aldehyde dehydrogenase 22A1 [Galdieria sulphuraria]|uniref:Aldehyde dehydrogenase n=1 Tax=Galdieria sulphuraria TaxID=130081 RepID=M2W269_GALSU|nr:aldehyde dehydrogenase [Galdieria sulphuraria]EME29791.1 aldehyde dehydrogenase [Galdieria sulphuraria]GJD06779.1 Aldehyde dehydrogenase 22A1 [Galdieria sulphuraria]|eukprot:XP_005706311.1 aldehyde dehydrogenase [Galdieria sulphuraria]
MTVNFFGNNLFQQLSQTVANGFYLVGLSLQRIGSYIVNFGNDCIYEETLVHSRPLNFAASVSGQVISIPWLLVVVALSTLFNWVSRVVRVVFKLLSITFNGESAGFLGLSATRKIPPRINISAGEKIEMPKYLLGKKGMVVDTERKLIHCYAPASGAFLGSVSMMDEKQVNDAVLKAKEAQEKWKMVSFSERRKVLRCLKKYIVKYQDDIVWMSCLDTGKTRVDAVLGEIITTLEKIRWLCAEGEAVLSTERRSVGPLTLHKTARVEYHPLGVIGAIAPWNYPFHNMYNPLLAALFSGNAFVIKPSEYSCWSSLYFAKIIRSVLDFCGYPSDLVQILCGDNSTGEALTRCPFVGKIFFTGSTKVGRLVAKQAAEQLKPVVLELGGKDPFIILQDADQEQAIELLMRGVFQNSGQNCVGVERVFVHRDIFEHFESRIVSLVSKLTVGNDLADENACVDLGAMTMGPIAIQNIQSLIQDALDQGAQILHGSLSKLSDKDSYLMSPIVLTHVSKDMRIMQEEVFGPVIVLISFEDDSELVELVNLCPFGLGSSVFSRDYNRANRIAAELQCGMCNINDFGVNYLCQSLPFGGTKASGSDRFSGAEGLRGCCLVKAVTCDRISGVRTRIPKPLRYPVKKNGYHFSKSLVEVLYEDSQLQRMRAVWQLIRTALSG